MEWYSGSAFNRVAQTRVLQYVWKIQKVLDIIIENVSTQSSEEKAIIQEVYYTGLNKIHWVLQQKEWGRWLLRK